MGAEPVPRREVVTGAPRARRPAARARRTLSRNSPAPRPAPYDEARTRPLMRRQLRAALTVVAFLAATLGPLPVLLRLLGPAPAAPHGTLVVWLLLGAAPYPVLLCAGAWYVRRAERNEADEQAR
ncbi:hypothetical protein KUM39_18450 [Streptomyces sp. J2-1]|uniref:hypothetical protein n=1 Tax=Streptomyces corallincola TaxID=2851888 RepID=UPI001C38D105|nr:hypothetical protein [Streptomyces corallincola]MBV2356336.1 hypothetical protein [Streptomyces corallincola]